MKTFLMKHEREILNGGTKSVGETKHLHSRLLIQWAYDIANGMQYLSRKHIMHGDLAARNILIAGKHFNCF